MEAKKITEMKKMRPMETTTVERMPPSRDAFYLL